MLARQLRSYLLLLLVAAALVSAVVGDRTEALIIGVIVVMSVGLSFFDEYRSEKAVEALHSQILRTALVQRDGTPVSVPITELVPGDVVHLRVGDVVPADLRLLEATALDCDESVLTGESAVAAKAMDRAPPGSSPLDLPSCTFMGTLVRAGEGRGVVVRTGTRTAFGGIALRLGERQALTSFQRGLQDFSRMLAIVTAVLAGSMFGINAALGRSVLESGLLALAIAVGLTPQLLPAIVTVSLATGSRRLARKQLIVQRPSASRTSATWRCCSPTRRGRSPRATSPSRWRSRRTGGPSRGRSRWGSRAATRAGTSSSAPSGSSTARRCSRGPGSTTCPFDHERQLASVLVERPEGPLLVAKGAPEAVLARCAAAPAEAQATLERLFGSGARVVAVATRALPAGTAWLDPADERDLELAGFLTLTRPAPTCGRPSTGSPGSASR